MNVAYFSIIVEAMPIVSNNLNKKIFWMEENGNKIREYSEEHFIERLSKEDSTYTFVI